MLGTALPWKARGDLDASLTGGTRERPAAAADAAAPVDPDEVPVRRAIPILGPAESGNGGMAGPIAVTLDPLVTQRTVTPGGVLADSADEHVGAGWHLPLGKVFTIGYDSGVNVFRQDAGIDDDEEATSEITTGFTSKGSLAMQTGTSVKWTGYVQADRDFTGGMPGSSEGTKHGVEGAWTPVKDVTSVAATASTGQTARMNGSILDEDLYGATVTQKLPFVPVTLRTSGSMGEDTTPMLTADDKDTREVDASLLWKIVDGASASAGVRRLEGASPGSTTLQDSYFSQLSVQPSDVWTVTMGAMRERMEMMGSSSGTGSDVLLNVGMTWNLGERFSAGAGVGCRVLQSQTPPPGHAGPPATVSVSAGGKF